LRADELATQQIGEAEELCRMRGRKLGKTARLLIGILAAHPKPVKAYELLEALSRITHKPVAPPTVYRALQFLDDLGIVARVVSQSAFVLCAHPGHAHDCIFFLCNRCGSASEIEDKRFAQLVGKEASALGFEPSHRVLEVQGTCRSCREARV
jgi:Fur family zinc uptake transcriptional regulator